MTIKPQPIARGLVIDRMSPSDALLLKLQGGIQLGQSVSIDELTPERIRQLANSGAAFVARDGEEILGIGGVWRIREGHGTAWVLMTRNWRRHARMITAAVVSFLDTQPGRVDTTVRCDWPGAHRWAVTLGFELEAPRMRQFERDGGDAALYARFR